MSPTGMDLVFSPLETKRFGFKVFRATASGPDAASLRRALLAHRPDLLIVRIPAAELGALGVLEELGVPIIVADTLVHYAVDLERTADAPLRNPGIEFTPAGAEDLESLVRLIFGDYVNHYAVNPLLPRQSFLDGYVEWAVGFTGESADRAAWIARLDGEPVAFATCAFSAEEADGILYGVTPAASGRGVYRDLIRFTAAQGRARGCRHMHVSTQIPNFPVQAVWAGEGFRLKGAETTLHVNALLDWAAAAPQRTACRWTAADLGGGDPWQEARLLDAVARRLLAEGGRDDSALPHTVRRFRVRALQAETPYAARLGVLDAPVGLAVLQVSDEAGDLAHQAYYHLPRPSPPPV
jgi:GNAT superfamily N-acetyltransferase